MHKLSKLKIIPIILLFFFVFSPVTLADSTKKDASLGDWRDDYKAKILAMVNKERISQDMSSLFEDADIQRAAQAKADDMAARGYFSHNTPEGNEPWYWLDNDGIKYTAAGENIAAKFTDPKDIVPAWMDSPLHKKNILNSKYTQTGIGVAKGKYQGKEVIFVVELYVKPASNNLSGSFIQKYF